jgi:outer membrane immunogenic protein
VDMLASIRGRLGFAVDNLLIYATGGVAFADADASTFEIGDFEANVDFDDIGGVVGGGLEFAVSDHFTIRAEGLFYFFDDQQDFDVDDGAEDGDFATLDDAFVVRAGVSWYPFR